MSGMMSAVGTAALQGGLAAASNQLMFSMIDNRLNMKNVSREMTSASTLKSIGQSAMTAGLTKGLSYATGIPTIGLHGFEEQAWGNAIIAAARLGTGLTFGEKPKDVLKSTTVNYGIDVVSGTISNRIGDWRLLNIEKNLLSDYVSHKLMHGALGAASRGIAAKLLGQNRSEVQKSMLGGALGAMAAEVVAEGLKDHLQENCDNRLRRESDNKTPEEIIKIKGKIRAEELTKICAYGELAATVLTQACGGDLEAACRAARNALDNNFSQMMLGVKPANFKKEEGEELRALLLQVLTDPSEQSDPLTDTLIQELRHFLKDGVEGLYKARQRLLEGEITDETIFKSAGATTLDAIGLAYMAVDKANGGTLSALVKAADLTTNVVGNTLGKIVEQAGGSKRTAQNTAELSKWGLDLITPTKAGKASQATKLTGANRKGLESERWLGGLDLAGFVKLPGHPHVSSTVLHAANHNRLPFEITRSANANRIYEDIRAVANGSNSVLGKNSVNSAWTMSSSSKGSSLFTSQHGSKPSVTAEQWIQKTIPDETITHRSRGTEAPSTPSLGRNLLTDKMEPKGKEVVRNNRSVSKVSSQAANERPSSSSGVYNPHQWRQHLESQYGAENVSSSTLPKQGSQGSKMAGQQHKKSEIVYDQRGNPDFSKHMKYETYLTVEQFYGKKSASHMRAATRSLRKDIKMGKVDATNFTLDQLSAINSGKAQIPGMTWHHDQQARRMQLVSQTKHQQTPHSGSVSLGKGYE
jgi:hypothetical protein